MKTKQIKITAEAGVSIRGKRVKQGALVTVREFHEQASKMAEGEIREGVAMHLVQSKQAEYVGEATPAKPKS